MGKNRVKKEDFSKFSTGEIPVSTGPVPALQVTHKKGTADFTTEVSAVSPLVTR
jgi:hypothetical protein